ncbi:MAG TPA: dihydropteroate synthase [Ruminococcaceae bacterium]|nr:dihydropteroate synthase [Oscillospiraceae bacterium]
MTFKTKRYTMPLGQKTYIMGIMNLTPDSFFAESRTSAEDAVARAVAMVQNGVDVLDLGAQSTAPKSVPITAEEEAERLIEPLRAIRQAVDVPLSVDTYFPEVARLAAENGADILNDVSGLASPAFAEIAAETGCGWIIMHTGEKKSSETADYSDGVICDINRFFGQALSQAESVGLEKNRLCFDPGIGFGKSRENDLEILRRFSELNGFGCAMLAALSRKRVTALCEDSFLGTLVADTACIRGGADILRVHDVPQAKRSAVMADSFFRNRG